MPRKRGINMNTNRGRDNASTWYDDVDEMYVDLRALRGGRKSDYVRRVLVALHLPQCNTGRGEYAEVCHVISGWDVGVHLLFWGLMGYDGRYMNGGGSRDRSGRLSNREWALSGMVGESKRLWAEVVRP